MFGWGPHWDFYGVLATIASWITGFILFLVWLAVIILFVRFLIIATRAAKLYLRTNGQHDGLLPHRPAAPPTAAAPAATPPATKPAPRPRTPKAP